MSSAIPQRAAVSSGVPERGRSASSTLAEANETLWRIYADLAQKLIVKARRLYANSSNSGLELEETVYAFESTTIDLCLKLVSLGPLSQAQGGYQDLHTLL